MTSSAASTLFTFEDLCSQITDKGRDEQKSGPNKHVRPPPGFEDSGPFGGKSKDHYRQKSASSAEQISPPSYYNEQNRDRSASEMSRNTAQGMVPPFDPVNTPMQNPMMLAMMGMSAMAPMMMQMFQQQMSQNMYDNPAFLNWLKTYQEQNQSFVESFMNCSGNTANTSATSGRGLGAQSSNGSSTSGSLNSTYSNESKNILRLQSEVNTTAKLLEKLDLDLQINPSNMVFPKKVRFFIIKSFTEEDVHRAVKYKVWCSTYYGNRRLKSAWEQMRAESLTEGEIYLFFSVNASGHFCGIAKMTSNFDPDVKKSKDIWCKDEHNAGGQNSKWRGSFDIHWLYVKDIPNSEFSQLSVAKNGGKPFPHSRDTQEIDAETGYKALRIFHVYKHKTSLLDDFEHYNKIEENEIKIRKEKEQRDARKQAQQAKSPNKNVFANNDSRRSSLTPSIGANRTGSLSGANLNGSRRGSGQSGLGQSGFGGVPGNQFSSTSILPSQVGNRVGLKSTNPSASVFEEVPGVMEKLRKSTVQQIMHAKQQGTMSGFIPVDQANTSVLHNKRRPNAIPIIKPIGTAEEEDKKEDESAPKEEAPQSEALDK